MKQNQLDDLNAELVQAIAQYTNGMITIVEFLGFAINMRRRIGDDVELAGLLDPNTGMQFPTVAETDAFMAQVIKDQEAAYARQVAMSNENFKALEDAGIIANKD